MTCLRLIILLFCITAIASNACAEDKVTVSHYQSESRYIFGLSLLDLVLSKLGKNYEVLSPHKE